MRLEFKDVNTNKLHDELLIAGVIPKLVQSNENITWITVEGYQVDIVNEVVEKHNPSPVVEIPSLEGRLAALEELMMGVI